MAHTRRTDPEGLVEMVEAPDYQTAQRTAKLALIARHRTPGYVIHYEDLGDGLWEIVYTNRPLRRDQMFNDDGIRIGTGGSKADWDWTR